MQLSPEPAARRCRWRRWSAPSSPACSARPIGRRGAHSVTILGVADLVRHLGAGAATRWRRRRALQRAPSTSGWRVGGLKMEIGFLVDGLTAMMMAVVTFVSLMVHIYTIGYMADDPGYQRFFSLHLAVHVLDADARDEQQLPAAVLRLGGGGPGVVPADRLLVHAADRDLRQPEGVPRQPGRRLRLHPRHRPDRRLRRHAELRRGVRARAASSRS